MALAFILLCTCTLPLPGCVSSSSECTSEECKNDAKITADVKASLKQHREIGGDNPVYVRTHGGVVYLTGQVATDLQRQTAARVASQVPGVGQVVNSIALTYGGL